MFEQGSYAFENNIGNYRLSLYEKAIPSDLSLQDKLRATAEGGFDSLEISIDETDEKLSRLWWSNSEIEKLKSAIEKTCVPIATLCLSGNRKFPLGSHDSDNRKQSLEIIFKAIDFAEKVGIHLIQIPGYDVYYETSDQFTADAFDKNLQKVSLLAARKGICIGIETMETPFIDTVEKGAEHVRKVNSPFIGLYPDIGNLHNACTKYGINVVDDLKTGFGLIYAAHLKETKPGIYRNMHFGEGGTEYVSCIAELLAQKVRLFTGEFWYLGQENWMNEIKTANAFLRDKIAKAYKLLFENSNRNHLLEA